MRIKFLRAFLSAVTWISWLAACSSPPTDDIPPSPAPIVVSYSPYLARVQDTLQVCGEQLPHIAIFFEQVTGEMQDFSTSDLVFWWGPQPSEMAFAFPLNEDELVVIVNPRNPKQALRQRELSALFSGSIGSWSTIGTLDLPVNVWMFPETNLLSERFRDEILNQDRITRLAAIAPSPQAMLEAVGDEPGAIGYLPRSWLTEQVKPLQIDPDLQAALRQPLLALTHSEPSGGIRDLLACLQTGPGQAKLAENYFPNQG
jgi:hypothetical protein